MRDNLTTGEAAKLCSVSDKTVVMWLRKGLLLGHTLPSGHRRILLSDLIYFAQRSNFPLRHVNVRVGAKTYAERLENGDCDE